MTCVFEYRFGLKRRGSHSRGNAQREFVCLGHGGEWAGGLEGEGHLCVQVTTEYLVDQALNMKLRLITAVMSESAPGEILDYFREQVGPHIREAVPESHQVHPHWVEGPTGDRRHMVLKCSNIIAGWQRSNAGRMCPHRFVLPPWDAVTAPLYDEILQDPLAVWGLAALRQCDR